MENNKGFSLVTAMGLGLIMISSTSLLIFITNKNRANTISSEKSKQVLAVVESGIDNIKLSLSSKRFLLTLNKSLWNTEIPITSTYIPNDCDFRADSTELSRDLKSTGTVGNGSYNLVDYEYSSITNVGTLIVDGQINDSYSKIRTEFLVDTRPSGTGSGLASIMANEMELKQLDVTASSLVCTNPINCPISCSSNTSVPTDAELKLAVGSTQNGNLNNADVKVGGSQVPPLPSNLPNPIAINLGNINSIVLLPRTGDTSNFETMNGKKVYYYSANSISNGSVLFDKNPNNVYKLQVFGNISYSGNNGIGISSTSKPIEPLPLQITLYGGTTSQNWNFGGTFCNTAFIHAPKATITFDGGGAGCAGMRPEFKPNNSPNFFGVVWANRFLAGNTNSVYFYEQEGVLELFDNNLANIQTNYIGSTVSWNRLAK